jgi:transcriptional regulator with XRE-family HTH domain
VFKLYPHPEHDGLMSERELKKYKRVILWRIRQKRLEMGLRQEDAAELIGISLVRYQEYESNRINFNPLFDTLVRFCHALKLEPEDLLKKPTSQEIRDSRHKDKRRAFKNKVAKT